MFLISFLRLLATTILVNPDPALDPKISFTGALPEHPVAYPYQSFKSSNATAPVLQIQKFGPKLAPGSLFFAPEVIDMSGFIMTDSGELVWCTQIEGVANMGVSSLHGKPVLSYWTGETIDLRYNYGSIRIVDTTYTEIYNICPKLGLNGPFHRRPDCEADAHESFITDRGTIVISAYNLTRADLRRVGGSRDGWVFDGQFYEIDIETQQTLFRWSSIEHIPVSKSIDPLAGTGGSCENPFDYFHINSIQPLDSGRYLVSGRRTNALFLIGPDGEVIWEFNGIDGGDFGPLSPNAHFSYQHHARAHNITDKSLTVQLFNNDNKNDICGGKQSSGLEFHLDTQKNTSTLLRRFHDPKHNLTAIVQGSFQRLPNGNTLLGYGSLPNAVEFGPDGDTDVAMFVTFGGDYPGSYGGSYRVFKQEWNAVPATRPDVAVDKYAGKGWVSWNGATSVTQYAIYQGSSKHGLVNVANFTKNGFETEFDLPASGDVHGERYLQVGAFEKGELLRKSDIIRLC